MIFRSQFLKLYILFKIFHFNTIDLIVYVSIFLEKIKKMT